MTDSINSRAGIQARIAERQRQRHYHDSGYQQPDYLTALVRPSFIGAHSRMGGGKRCGNNLKLRAFLNLQRFWRSGWFSMGCLWCMG
jgi:hypothetical protein